jgi:hypothetical protein
VAQDFPGGLTVIPSVSHQIAHSKLAAPRTFACQMCLQPDFSRLNLCYFVITFVHGNVVRIALAVNGECAKNAMAIRISGKPLHFQSCFD